MNACETVASQVAQKISAQMPNEGEPRDRVSDVFEQVQARVVGMMGGASAAVALLGDCPLQFIASGVQCAHVIGGIICRSAASRASFVEHCYQEALALTESHKPVVVALAQALVDHPERTLHRDEINVVINTTMACDSLAEDRSRRAAWRALTVRVQRDKTKTLE